MLLKYLMFISTLIISVVIQNSAGNDEETFDKGPYAELPCLSVGGICTASDDCPKGKQARVKGLCPVQQNEGYECCYSLPKSETRCRRRGGHCIPRKSQCPENLTFREATDCAYDEKCCILV